MARLEEERLLQQLDQVQQVKTLEEQIEERYHQRLESRSQIQNKHKNKNKNNGSNDINTSGAGIGTKQRRRAEQKRKRTALPPSLRNNNNNKNRSGDDNGSGSGSGSVAIYVSNLPVVDDNERSNNFDEEDTMIRALFGSYGSIRKIHFYVDKTTGRRKGDALVIYSLNLKEQGEQDNEASSLTESVCSQVCTRTTYYNNILKLKQQRQ